MLKCRAFYSAAAVVTLVHAHPASAANWLTPNGGTWGVAANWSTNDVPDTAAEDVSIFTSGNVLLDADYTIGALTLSNGTIAGSTRALTASSLNWTRGVMFGTSGVPVTGNTTITGNATLAPAASNLLLNSRMLTLQGSTTYGGVPNSGFGLYLDAGAIVNAAGTFSITDDSSVIQAGPDNTFHVSGTLTKTGGAGTSTIPAVVNSGTINVNSGKIVLLLKHAGTSSGAFNAAPGTRLDLGVGTHTFASGSTFSGANIRFTGSGTFNASGTVIASGGSTITMDAGASSTGGRLGGLGTWQFDNFVWTGGTMQDAGNTTVTGNATLAPATSATQFLIAGRTLNLQAYTTYGGAASTAGLKLQSGGVINSSGTFSITDDSNISSDGNTANAFNNIGTLTKTGGTGASTVAGLVNTGTVTVYSGTLNAALRGGAVSTGAFNYPAGTTLNLSAAGTHTLSAAATLNGEGTFRFAGGTINLEGTRSFARPLTLADGAVNFNGPTALDGGLTLLSTMGGDGAVNTPTLTWAGGTMNGSGTTQVSGTATLSADASYLTLSGRTLNLQGNTTQSSTSNLGLSLQNGGVVNNTGTYSLIDDSNVTGGSGGEAFKNVGALTKTGGTGTSTVAALVNTGTVKVTSGALVAILKNSGESSTGTFLAMPGRVLRLSADSGLLTLPTASTIGGGGTIDFNSNTTVAGTVTADGTGLSVASTRVVTITGVIADPPAPAAAVGLTKLGVGQLTLAGVNTYTAPTTVAEGTLVATDGVGLPAGSALILNGGSLGTSGAFTRNPGVGAGKVSLVGSAGFVARGGDLVIALGGVASAAPLVVGQSGFAPTTLLLNNGTAAGTIELRNNIDLAGSSTFEVSVSNGPAAAATLSGDLTDSTGGGTFTKSGGGLLSLTGTNTYGGRTNLAAGTLRARGASLSDANLTFNGGILGTHGTFSRSPGSGAGRVQLAAGGFSAEGGDLTISLGDNAPLVWGTTPGFSPVSLVLGGPFATHTATLTNNIDLSTGTLAVTRTLSSQGGTNVVSGVISNTGAAQGRLAIEGATATGGTIVLSGTNTYAGTTLIDTGAPGPATVRATNSSAFGSSLIQFQAAGGATTGRLELANAVVVNNNVNLTGRTNPTPAIENLSDTNTLGGTINLGTGGNAYVIQSNAGLLTLTGAAGSTAGTAVRPGNGVTGSQVLTLQGDGDGVVSGLLANNTASLAVAKAGAGKWTLSGVNTFSGPVSLFGGLLATDKLANGGANSGLGRSTNVAASVQLIGGGLQYIGPAASTDRLFTIGAGGGGLDTSGTGAVTFGNSGSIVTADGPASGTIASNSNLVTVTAGNLAGLSVGQAVSGSGIPTGATVSSINYNAGTFTMSANATAARTGVALSFGPTAARTLTLSGSNAANNTLAGTLSNSAAGTILGVSKTGPGMWVLKGANSYTGTTSIIGGTLRVASAVAIGNLLSTTTGGVTLGDAGGTLVLDYTGGSSPAGAVRSILTAGSAGSFAIGQIRSSLTGNHTIGYRDDGTAVTVRVTLFGDTDLDGGISINDFNALAGNFGRGGKVWADGDFDYDGGVSINDFNLLAGGFGQSVPASSGMWAGLLAFAAAHDDLAAFEAVTGVPEPTTICVVTNALAFGLRRQRRRA